MSRIEIVPFVCMAAGHVSQNALYWNSFKLELAINLSIQERLAIVLFVILIWQSLLDKQYNKGAFIGIEKMILKETFRLGRREGRSV